MFSSAFATSDIDDVLTSMGIDPFDRLLTGDNVKVAIIDKSFCPNDISGNIVFTRDFTNDSNLHGEKLCLNDDVDSSNPNFSHGTRVAETVSQISPGVDLYLYKMTEEADFSFAIATAAFVEDVDLIVTSVGFDFPLLHDAGNATLMDGTSIISATATNAVQNKNISFIQATSNRGSSFYVGDFTDNGFPLGGQITHEFQNISTAQSACLPITIPANEITLTELYWDGWPNRSYEYDMHVYTPSLTNLLFSAIFDSVKPITSLNFPVLPQSADYCLVVATDNIQPSDNIYIEFTRFEKSPSQFPPYNLISDPILRTHERTLAAPADGVDVLGVGAVNFDTKTMEIFSSRGPTADGRTQPQVCSYDDFKIFPDDSAGHPGTSFAAPVVAGIAAMLLEEDPSRTPAQIKQIISDKASKDGIHNSDNVCGAGLAQFLRDPPTVVASANPTQATEGNTIALDGDASQSNPTGFGSIVSYEWSQQSTADFPSGNEIVFVTGPNIADPIIQLPQISGGDSVAVMQLKVTDDLNITSTQNVQVTVLDDDGGNNNDDSDNDGIADSIDTSPSSSSTEFDNNSGTTGKISVPGTQKLSISDSSDNNGVDITSESTPAGNDPAMISLCNNTLPDTPPHMSSVTVSNGDSITATCGSVTVDVHMGGINMYMYADDADPNEINDDKYRAVINGGNSLTFDPTIPSFTTLVTNLDDVGITAPDFDFVSIAPGNTVSPPVDAPASLTANAASSSQIDLSWVEPENKGGTEIIGYKIERESPVGNGFSVLVADTGSDETIHIDINGLLPDTPYNYKVSAINAIGTGSSSIPASAQTLDDTTDTTPPQINIDSPADGSIINSSDVTITVTATDDESGVTGVGISVNGVQQPAAIPGINDTWSLDLTNLDDATYSIEVTATNNVELTSPVSSISFTVDTDPLPDTTPPQVTITSPVDNSTISTSNLTISGIASDLESGITQVTISIDSNTPPQTATLGANDTWSFDVTNLVDGVHSIDAIATNGVGLTHPDTLSFTVDTTLPPPSTANLLAHYTFENNSLLDSSTLQNDATISAGGTGIYAGGIVGIAAFDFNGSTNLNVPNESDYDFEHTDPFSISLWFNSDDLATATSQPLLVKASGLGTTGYSLYLDNSDHLVLSISNRLANPDELQVLASGFTAAQDTWYHVSVTYDGTGSTNGISSVNMYIDGVPQTVIQDGATGTVTQSILNNSPIRIGGMPSNAGNQHLYGALDDIRIYDGVLTQQEVGDLYALGDNSNPVDTTPPQIAIISPTDNSTISTSNLTISGIASDLESGITQVTISIDSNTPPQTATLGANDTWSFDVTNLVDGVHSIDTIATNGVGLTHPDTLSFTVDTTLPPPSTANLLAHYTFENNSLLDSSTLQNDATISAGGTGIYAGGIVGIAAFDFNGSTNLNVPNESDYDFEHTDPFSISLWFNSDDLATATSQPLLVKASGLGTTGYSLYLDNSDHLVLSISNRLANPDELQVLASGFTAAQDTWYHVSVTYDGTGSTNGISSVNMYIDGVPQTVIQDGATGTVTQSILNNSPIRIGGMPSNAGNQHLYGALDDIRIYDGVLTQQEVGDLYALGDNSNPVDTTPPQIAIISPTDNSTISTSNLTISGIASDLESGITQVTISIDSNTPPQTATLGANDTWSFDVTNLVDGVHSIDAIATNGVGLTHPDTLSFTVDTTLPPPSTANLLAHYTFENNSLLDSSTLQNDATISAGGTGIYAGGIVGIAAFDFNGSTNLNVPNESDYDFEHTDPFSISLWFNSDDLATATSQPLLVKASGLGTTGYSLYLDNSDHLVLSISNRLANPDELQVLASGFTAAQDTWYHVSVTYDGTGSTNGISSVNMYIDGVPQTVIQDGATGTVTQSILNNSPIRIGGMPSNAGNQHLYGALDDIRIYDGVLTQQEVGDLYNMQNP